MTTKPNPTQLPEQTETWEAEGGNVPQTDPTIPKEEPKPLEPKPASEHPKPIETTK